MFGRKKSATIPPAVAAPPTATPTVSPVVVADVQTLPSLTPVKLSVVEASTNGAKIEVTIPNINSVSHIYGIKLKLKIQKQKNKLKPYK
jgi:hypothetical protein